MSVGDERQPVASWVLDGWYGNNPGAQKIAIGRFYMPVTTAADREAVKSFQPTPAHPCVSCGRFAFAAPDAVCFWCRRVTP